MDTNIETANGHKNILTAKNDVRGSLHFSPAMFITAYPAERESCPLPFF